MRARLRTVTCLDHPLDSQTKEENEEESCNACPCCTVADWTPWSPCSKPCNGGIRQRYQSITCLPGAPANSSVATEEESCQTNACTCQVPYCAVGACSADGLTCTACSEGYYLDPVTLAHCTLCPSECVVNSF